MVNNSNSEESIVVFLRQQLRSQTDPIVRRSIVLQLGNIGDRSTIADLQRIVQHDKDSLVRALAVEALGKIYQKSERNERDTLSYLYQTIIDLQSRYPDLNDTNIDRIIDVEFTTIRKQDPQKWQRLKDVMSVAFAGGIEAVKILVPVAGIPIEVTKQLYEIWQRNQR
jgi:HEAT repeat protein